MTLNKHLKILMVVAHYPFPIVGGLEKQAHELSKSLILKQITVSVLSGKFANSQDNIELIDGDLEESYHTDIQDFENEE